MELMGVEWVCESDGFQMELVCALVWLPASFHRLPPHSPTLHSSYHRSRPLSCLRPSSPEFGYPAWLSYRASWEMGVHTNYQNRLTKLPVPAPQPTRRLASKK